ncbi:unnamed protein product [Arabis nemorensis]|uniref:Uncharacterized protein n=1 Tax=Arabis nemorensis TaxID=586526 RepID=A0A565CN17_9BRAS|nr:unnamed protein product [Arabis nemorensis]
MTTTVSRKKRHFQFFNYLTDHPLFLETIASCWDATEEIYHSRSAIYRFHKKLKLLKPLLRTLNRDRYGDITRRTKTALDVLCERQRQALENPCAETFEREAEAARQWHHYADVEESFFRQKSREIIIPHSFIEQFRREDLTMLSEN